MVASITPAWTAATTSSPGCWRTTSRTASEARATNSRPALAARRDGHGRGRWSQSGTPKVSTTSSHSMPSASPGCSSHRSQRSRTGPSAVGSRPHHGPEPLGRLDRPGQHRGVQRRRLAQLAALVEPVGQRGHLAAPQVGQPRAALRPADDAVEVALRLAVADQHDPRSRPRSGGKMRSTPASARSARPCASLTPGFRRSARAGAACGTPPRRRSGRRTRPRWSRPTPSSHAARG